MDLYRALIQGNPPEWASGWGQDEFGVFLEFTIAEVTQRLRWVSPGEFLMGSPEDEPGRYDDEGPQHKVVLTQGYWMFDTPVTQSLWEVVMGNNPSEFKSADRPVEMVSWLHVNEFIEALNQRRPGLLLSLPSEAQWEYACRASSDTALYNGALEVVEKHNAPALDTIAWYSGNSGEGFDLEQGKDTSGWQGQQYDNDKAGSRPVMQKQPNNWGLYDMLGNIWEFTADEWQEDHEGAFADGRTRMSKTDMQAKRLVRGGSWFSFARVVRSATRNRVALKSCGNYLGFRCARIEEELR